MANGGRRSVLALVKGLGPGGAEHLLLSAARVRNRDLDDMHVAYVLSWKDHLVGALEGEGVAATCVGGRIGMRDLRWIPRLRRLVRDGRYDVVHLHSPVVAAVARIIVRTLPRSARPAVVSTEHNVWSSHTALTRWANRLTYPLGDAWIAVSDEVRSSLPLSLQPRTEVVVHGIMLDALPPLLRGRADVRAELGVAADEVLVVTIANLRRTKGYPDLLLAARSAKDRCPALRFAAVGQGPMQEELVAMAADLGLADSFRFLGYEPDAVRLLAGADIFAMASLHEGYPIAVMEALAVGVPVVATTVGGIPEAIEEGVSGLLVPPGEPERLADAMVVLAGNPRLRHQMGVAGRRSAGRYDIRVAVRRVEDIYAEVSSDR